MRGGKTSCCHDNYTANIVNMRTARYASATHTECATAEKPIPRTVHLWWKCDDDDGDNSNETMMLSTRACHCFVPVQPHRKKRTCEHDCLFCHRRNANCKCFLVPPVCVTSKFVHTHCELHCSGEEGEESCAHANYTQKQLSEQLCGINYEPYSSTCTLSWCFLRPHQSPAE